MSSDPQIFDLLPLPLLRSQIVPPAATFRKSAVDFVADFGGSSWIAYSASSFLVISQFPSPLSEPQTLIGPSFRQVIDPKIPSSSSSSCDDDDDGGSDVIAVSWCPARPSNGEIAAAVVDCVLLFAPDSVTASGSFCWRQTAGLVQSFTVEAIAWTGSGDGLIAAGIDVVLWKRKHASWEVAWKSKAELPQALVSATLYAEGLVATAANLSIYPIDINAKNCSLSREDYPCVSVYHNDGDSGSVKVQLCHPQPVTMIQWRPSTITWSDKDVNVWRDVLLTCCLDGTVRLWSEVDNGRGKKHINDAHEQKSVRQSFHVVAVMEINQCLGGALGTDIFIDWAMELGSVISKVEGDGYCLSSAGSQHDLVGKCEWLISIGPRHTLTFWAIHCLDDVNPLRFPRMTLWKKQNLKDFRSYDNLYNSDFTNVKDQPILIKSFISRNLVFGPPIECSLLQLLPNNSVSWSQLYSPKKNGVEGGIFCQISKEESLSGFAAGVLSQDGHTGSILQLAIHPCVEVEVAVSLDSNGFLVFWSIPTISNCTLGMQILGHPLWQLLGKISLQDLSDDTKYSSLRWAPSVLDENLFLLLGFADGIDCFLIKLPGKGKGISCDKILTIPFAGHSPEGDPPDQLSITPMASSCGQSIFSNSFLLFAIWTNKFQAFSWKVVLHHSDPSGSSCRCRSEDRSISSAGIVFYATVDLGSSLFPDPQTLEHVISICSTSDSSMLSTQQCITSFNLSSNKYHLATGLSDGTLKLWKMSHAGSKNSGFKFVPWELVGMFTAHEGPVSAVSLSSCGSKVATISIDDRNSTTNLHIWEPICLIAGGSFLLEDEISLNGPVTALNWLSLGNGHLLLAICLPNELRIYSEKRSKLFLENSGKSKEVHIWCCVSQSHTCPVSHGFLWGPQMTPVVIHKKHFSLFSKWLFKAENEIPHEGTGISVGRTEQDILSPIFAEGNIYDNQKASKNGSRENGLDITTFLSKTFYPQHDSDFGAGIRAHSLLDIADRLSEKLAVFHPMALLHHLYSGNWKCAYVVLKHLFEAIKSYKASATSSVDTKSGKSRNNVPEINLSRYFEEIIPMESGNRRLQWGQDLSSGTSSLLFQNQSFQFEDDISSTKAPENFSSSTSQKTEILSFIDTLEKFSDINALQNIEKTQLLAIIDLLGELSESSYSSVYDSLDKPGRRLVAATLSYLQILFLKYHQRPLFFPQWMWMKLCTPLLQERSMLCISFMSGSSMETFWVAVRFQSKYSFRKFGRTVAEEPIVNSGLLAWAFQSDCQDDLLSSLLSANPSWPEMRNLGIGFWFTNTSQLRTRMEKLAKSQYLIRKDPKDCALLYLALNRLQVLAGLFKISKDEKDKPLVGFLSRNFQEEKNKAAALKNAYVLMGRHQLELAVAFFLLGGDHSSAVTVCAKNLGDEQLALVICRLIEGHGGELEHQLISNHLLPNAIEKEDYWLASLLEWALGNYSCSVSKLLDSHCQAPVHNSAVYNLSAFLDPDIGQYCVTLAAKNNMKNSLGDFLVMVLSKLSRLMSMRAFNRCGLPLEALECFTSSVNIEDNDRGTLSDVENHMIFRRILKPISTSACNWLLKGIADTLEFSSKISMAMQYISKLLKDHPSWPLNDLASSEMLILDENYAHQDEKQVCECITKLDVAITTFERKYLVNSVDLANEILAFTSIRGLLFHGYRLLHGRLLHSNSPRGHDTNSCIDGTSILGPGLPRFLLRATREISCVFSRFVVCCNLTDSVLWLLYGGSFTGNESYGQYLVRDFCLRSVIFSLRTIRALVKLCGFHVDLYLRIISVLDLFEYCVHLALSWFGRNVKGLILMVKTMLNELTNHQSSFEAGTTELMKLKPLRQSSEWMVHDALGGSMEVILDSNATQWKLHPNETSMLSIPDDEVLQLIGASLWMHLSSFANHKLSKFIGKEMNEDGSTVVDLINVHHVVISRLFATSTAYISSLLTRQLASFLKQKVSKGLRVTSFVWLNESSHHSTKKNGPLEATGAEESVSLVQKLWKISVCTDVICENFMKERIDCFPYHSQKFFASWKDIQKALHAEDEGDYSLENKVQDFTVNKVGSVFNKRLVTEGLTETRNTSPHRDITFFHGPMEVLKRNGELLEAICFNSIDEHQVAVASNRKGLVFFNWKSGRQLNKQAEYLWSELDWPQDGWARRDSKLVPTYVSEGIGLGSKSAPHLGLGGATIGLGSLARPGRDLTGGGAFGIPGYAGIGASGLSWCEQQEFEEFADPPVTVTNISSQALSQHPCRPLFLVGSSNTHVYLWEFGKDKATATYGILPAANVPPPYALASISALQFDHCGHRFASAAVDGTVCTWQLEVGGRGNMNPTESSLCFSNHASDVAYVAASGSVVAAAGCSANGVNVVVWDTLAPPVTPQASLVCHEGGARSLSVFDNDVGSASISPLIVTGGKSGDVGLHDFRFIATGKTKRDKNSTQQVNNMLWYIPKAHLGCITRVSCIPSTSLFLTGSKDGDVKLWDAKRSQLVCHWPKMHDRHTFLQPNSRSIGGVVRAAVTDIQVFSHGFLTCGGDGSVKLVRLK